MKIVNIDLISGNRTERDLTQEEIIEIQSQSIVDPVPQVVTMRQARLALLSAGLLDQVQTAIAQAPRAFQIAWEFASDVERNSPVIAALSSTLGLTEEQIDNLFILAGGL